MLDRRGLQLAGLPQRPLLAVERLGQDLVTGGLGLAQLEPGEEVG